MSSSASQHSETLCITRALQKFKMSKTVAVGTLIVCATAFLGVSCSLESPTFSRYFMVSASNSSTVPFNGHLYTVSKNQSHIHVNSSDSNHQPCDIAINAERDVTHGILEVTPTEEEIFIVGVKSIDENEKYKYTILRVDPTACSCESADLPETNDSRGDYFLPRLVRHHTGTDVFFPSLQNCAPCRLNRVGLRSRGTTPQIPRETTPPGVPFHVRFFNSPNSYFYVYNIHNLSASVESTTLKVLDGNDFSTKKQRVIDFPVHAVSKQKQTIRSLGFCTKTYDDFMADISAYTEVRCDRLNPNLETVNTVRIPIEPHSEPISSISYEFDKEGNSYVSFAEDTKLRLYIHSANGELIKAIDMGRIDARFEHYPDSEPEYFDAYDYWDVRGFLIGNEYCMVTEQVSTKYPTPLHQVRCIDFRQYTRH